MLIRSYTPTKPLLPDPDEASDGNQESQISENLSRARQFGNFWVVEGGVVPARGGQCSVYMWTAGYEEDANCFGFYCNVVM